MAALDRSGIIKIDEVRAQNHHARFNFVTIVVSCHLFSLAIKDRVRAAPKEVSLMKRTNIIANKTAALTNNNVSRNLRGNIAAMSINAIKNIIAEKLR